MLLEDILSGKERSHLILVHDNINQNGRPLLHSFVKSLLESADFVHAILWDVAPDQFFAPFDDPHLKDRIHCYDGFSDPLEWNNTRNECHGQVTTIHLNSNVAEVMKNNMKNCALKRSSDEVIKMAVVMDSLSRLLLWKSPSAVGTLLHQLYSNLADMQTGYQVVQVVCLVHSDLHDEHTLNTVNFLASSILWLTQDNQQSDADEAVTWCRVLHKRKTGKVIKKMGSISIGSDYGLTEHEEKDWNTSSPVVYSEPTKEVDPTQNLTFNLRLTADERQARSSLKLPYMYHEEKTSKITINRTGEGKVFYQPDEADDFDDDDPDDDLDI